MDSPLVGLVGGIVGSGIGVLGGLIGTYYSIKNANGPKERRLVFRLAALLWVGVTAFLASLFLVPFPWRFLLWLVYLPSLFWFARRANAALAHARSEDKADADFSGGQVVGP